MSRRRGLLVAVVLVPALVAALAITAVAVSERGSQDALLREQRHPPAVTATDLARVVRTAPDPRTGRDAGRSATCRSLGGRGILRNPWTCEVRYPDGKLFRLDVHVDDDGSYTARYEGGGAASGCCVTRP
jgi:hypothetical protein